MADATTSSSKSRSPGSINVDEKHQTWSVSPSTVVYHFGTSGISVAAATGITHPLDVLKVRLQMQLAGQRGPLLGMGQLFIQVVKNEGPGSFYLGVTPALTRSILYGGLRLGLYEPSKYVSEQIFGCTNIFVRIASGAFSGAFSTALTNPIEVLKVRLQMNPKMNRGAFGEMRSIAAEEGVKALWKGVGPAMTRAAALTASQLATYDESKQLLIKWTPLEEGFYLHLMLWQQKALRHFTKGALLSLQDWVHKLLLRLFYVRSFGRWLASMQYNPVPDYLSHGKFTAGSMLTIPAC